MLILSAVHRLQNRIWNFAKAKHIERRTDITPVLLALCQMRMLYDGVALMQAAPS